MLAIQQPAQSIPAKDEHIKTVKCRELNPGLSGQEDQPELTDLHLIVIG